MTYYNHIKFLLNMKKYLFILASVFIGFAANAQVGNIEYQSIYSGQGTNYRNSYQSSGQTVRTTAYSLESNRHIIKTPIKVNVASNSYGIMQIRVVEQYVTYGIGGKWQKTTPTNVTECMAMYANNPLEQQFMYKAMIGGKWYYFDL